MEKLKKTANTLDLFFKVTYRITLVFNIIGIVIIVLFLLLCLMAPGLFGSITSGMATSLDFGGIQFRLADGISRGSTGALYFISSLIVGVAGLTVYVLMIRNIRSILAPMKEALPFDTAVAKGFRNLGILTILSGGLNLILEFFVNGSLVRSLDLRALFLSEKITAVTTYYNFDFTFVITALVLFGLGYIFRYGEQLQQLSDETL